MFGRFYEGRRVMVTGCYGFKGSWLVRWLEKMGATVYEFGHLPRTQPSHAQLLGKISRKEMHESDLLDYDATYLAVQDFQPEIIFHLAAKAVVAETFKYPRYTFYNNIMSTVNLLEAVRKVGCVRGVVVITTDKVYSNKEWNWGYRENDELGGSDPYSASKVCVEQVIDCYRKEFFPMIATARAGNVIGGGDWSEHRLIPDIIKAAIAGKEVEIHTPSATRPWQHVLEPLSGYLKLGQKLLEGNASVARHWNFGPAGEMTVMDVLRAAQRAWPLIKCVIKEQETHPSMVQLLKIDSTEARKRLKWKPVWRMEAAVRITIAWYREYYEKNIVLTDRQIDYYEGGMQ